MELYPTLLDITEVKKNKKAKTQTNKQTNNNNNKNRFLVLWGLGVGVVLSYSNFLLFRPYCLLISQFRVAVNLIMSAKCKAFHMKISFV